ncbi:MAG: hypothetical protein AAF577_04965 [Pseudomonadota bacterium]
MLGWLRTLLTGNDGHAAAAAQAVARPPITAEEVAAILVHALDHYMAQRTFMDTLDGYPGFICDNADRRVPIKAMNEARGISARETLSSFVLRMEHCDEQTAMEGAEAALQRRLHATPIWQAHEENHGADGKVRVERTLVEAGPLGIERPVMCDVLSGRYSHFWGKADDAPRLEVVQLLLVANSESRGPVPGRRLSAGTT